jgi:type III secretion protein T
MNLSGLNWALLFIKEGLIGLLIGIACSGVFWIAQSFGIMLDAHTGFNSIQQTEPMRGEENTPLGNAFLQCSVALFHMTGGLTAFLWLVFDSYRWWPLQAALPDPELLLSHLLSQLGSSFFRELVSTAAGLVGVLILIDWAIGLLNRIASSLDVSALSQPIKAAATLTLLAAWIQQDFQSLVEATRLQAVCLSLQNAGLLPASITCR